MNLKDKLAAATIAAKTLFENNGQDTPPLTEEGVLAFAQELGVPAPRRIDDDDDMWVVKVTITPEMAANWLARYNTSNRPLDNNAIGRHKNSMEANNWKRTHQGIAFDCQNRLADGQHRLEACVRAGTSFTTYVWFGLDNEEKMAVDRGLIRKTFDQATLAGLPMSARHQAVATVLAAGIEDPKSLHRSITDTAIIGFYMKFKSSIDFAVDGLLGAPRGVKNASVMTAFAKAHASGKFEAQVLEDAMNILSGTKVEISQAQQPMITLRNWLMDRGTRVNTRPKPNEVLRKTLRALKALEEGATINALHAVAEDPYPAEFAQEELNAAE